MNKTNKLTCAKEATWQRIGFFVSATLLCLLICLECGVYNQRIKLRQTPEPTGKYGWSAVLPRIPAPALLFTGPTWCSPPLQVQVEGRLLRKGGAGFNEILELGDGRFNQFGERVFFSLPQGMDYRALANITLIRPVFFHPWIEALILVSFVFFLRCTYLKEAQNLLNRYEQWCHSKKLPSCLLPLLVIVISMFWQISQTLPAKTVFFNPDSDSYLSPESAFFRRPFGYTVFLKLLCQLTGEIWLAGPIQWLAYASAVVGLGCLFEKYFKNGLLAFALGTILISKIAMIKWAYTIGTDCLFASLLAWFFIGIVSLIMEKTNLRACLQISLCFAAALALRPIGAFLAVMPIFVLFATKSRGKILALLLSTALLVPLVCEQIDKASANFWHSPNPNFKSTGMCTLGSITWFLDKNVQTEYAELRDLIVDATADLRTRYKSASGSEKITMDHRDIFPITWERLPAALTSWRNTAEAVKLGIKPTDDIYSASVDKVFTRLAFETLTQRTPQVMTLGLLRAQDVISARLTGEWLVPLYAQLSGMESGVTQDNRVRGYWIKHYPFNYFETKDPGKINLFLEKNRLGLNSFVVAMFLLTCISVCRSLCLRQRFSQPLAVTSLAWLMSAAYFGAVACMQPVLDRYSEPIVSLVLFAAFGQLLLVVHATNSFCFNSKPRIGQALRQSENEGERVLANTKTS